jgi:hypothetical protein
MTNMSRDAVTETGEAQLITRRNQVEAMAGYGIPEAEIAKVLEIEPEKLRELYGKVIDGARTKANAKVAESLFRKATGEGRESVTAAIFWLKTRAGWKETSTHELTGADGGALRLEQTNSAADQLMAKMSEIAQRRAKKADK